MLKVANSVINASRITGVLPVANGGTNASTASITSFNNITGFTASGTTGTTSTNLVFATTPTLVGDVNLSTGNLVIGTSGKGIDFSVTSSGTGTMTSELFADYEEGTFTAGIAFGGAAVGITYDTTPTCTYTKIGRQVTVTGRVGLSSKGSSTGDATITGLPFTSANTGNAGYGANSIAMNLVTFANQYVLYTVPNSTSLGLYENTILGVQSSITDADFGNFSNLFFTSTYFV